MDSFNTQTSPNTFWPRWRLIECALLVTFVVSRLVLLRIEWQGAIGFDMGPHIDMLHILSWKNPTADIRTIFYGYHPPLAFLLPRTLFLLGISDVHSIQIISTASTLIAFFFLRATLKAVKILWHPASIVFLYITSSIPLQIYLSYSVNMESVLLACGAAAFYFSVRLFWQETEDPNRADRATLYTGLVTSLAIGLLTKFNAVLLLAIPLLVACVQSEWRMYIRKVFLAACVTSVAVAIVFPYYYTRYYIPEGTFFPSNADYFDAGPQDEARMIRDQDKVGFLLKLFSPTPVHAAGPEFRDLDHLRLADTWKDFWVRDAVFGPSSPLAQSLSHSYMSGAVWLMILGTIALLIRLKQWTVWDRLGLVIIVLTLLYSAMLVHYNFEHPCAGCWGNKGIYVAPGVLGVGYLIANALHMKHFLPGMLRRRWSAVEHVAVAATAVFVILNHWLPVY